MISREWDMRGFKKHTNPSGEVIRVLKGAKWCIEKRDFKGGIDWEQLLKDINQAISKITGGNNG